MRQVHLFEGGARLQMNEAIELTIASLQAYGPQHEHWAVAWSGGKDSSATLTLLVYLIDSGKVPRPRTLTVFYMLIRLTPTDTIPIFKGVGRLWPQKGSHHE